MSIRWGPSAGVLEAMPGSLVITEGSAPRLRLLFLSAHRFCSDGWMGLHRVKCRSLTVRRDVTNHWLCSGEMLAALGKASKA